MGNFRLESTLLAYSNKSPRLILIQKIVEVYGSMVTISHLGECFRGGQYTLVTFLFAPRLSLIHISEPTRPY